MDIQSIKLRFGIVGNSPLLDRAITIAAQVAATDLSVLVTGESGVGKEFFPKIIHQMSARKHGTYIAVNCGAIPEGTIDSELFGHEKGSFTGASEARKGYFEVANGGTIFLDEVAELPLATQVRLLRVLESGEFMKVGSSKTLKTNVRIVAATNVNVPDAIAKGKFREDLFYRLNSVPLYIPALRERKEDIEILFRRFAADFADKYRVPVIRLTDDAKELLKNYEWSGNIRQLRNITEQISIIEEKREITAAILEHYLPKPYHSNLPILAGDTKDTHLSERDILYKILFDMKQDINDLKSLVRDILQEDGDIRHIDPSKMAVLGKAYRNFEPSVTYDSEDMSSIIDEPEVIENSFSLEKNEKEIIKKALEKHNGKRKYAAEELGISERTLYRKLKEYDLED